MIYYLSRLIYVSVLTTNQINIYKTNKPYICQIDQLYYYKGGLLTKIQIYYAPIILQNSSLIHKNFHPHL